MLGGFSITSRQRPRSMKKMVSPTSPWQMTISPAGILTRRTRLAIARSASSGKVKKTGARSIALRRDVIS